MNNSKFGGLGCEKNAVDLQLEGNTMGGAKHIRETKLGAQQQIRLKLLEIKVGQRSWQFNTEMEWSRLL